MALAPEHPIPTTSSFRLRGRWLDRWEPEDPAFWRAGGRRTAWKNLVLSIFSEHLGFSVWVLMSIVVTDLGSAGYDFTVGQTFWLLIVPNLVGSVLRVPYTFATPRFGGRAWTTVSSALLAIPCAMLLLAVTNEGTPYWFFLLTAAAMGLGGGNFSSSMANISFFFPEREKGLALGLNAAGGNIGVAVTQLAVPLVISIGTGTTLAYAALMWLPVVVLSASLAWLFMDSITAARPDGHSYRTALRSKHTWVMSLLYVGTFGSFIGYSFAFPTLIELSFAGYEHYVGLAFIGAAIGSAARPFGGWLSDRIGGARVTVWTFVALGAGTVGVLISVTRHDFGLFFASFVALFVFTGIGNGSTYRMIPAIFAVEAHRTAPAGADPARVTASAKRQAAAVVGVCGALGAFGGVLVNLVFRFSLLGADADIASALLVILACYVVCLVVTWWFYLRRGVAAGRAPSLATARV
ncbi:MFS transporter [Saccharomonospora piscinae]|uniref:MFS transporter n=1 Tax=Saccharomonospora piscinae TaxID=687388 RepID=A0A1V8ZZS0_SACPI|nr:nitrate/nitrite transporter [Saccharomonospora piscinae]OQO90276.1 MFS transporter [Saccharomonospora piscinae]